MFQTAIHLLTGKTRIMSSYAKNRNIMAILHTENLSWPRKVSVFAGIALIVLSVILSASTLFGLLELESFAVLGHSGIRTLAGIAVAGCMVAAIGSFDE
jgi:hypothetical protein